MRFQQPTIILVITFLSFGCKGSNEEVYENQTGESLIETNHIFPLFGVWQYNFPFYSSELTIHRDGSFEFHDKGCLGHGYSEGRWQRAGQQLILTSYSKYKEAKKPLETIVKSNPVRFTKTKFKSKKSRFKYYYSIDLSSFNYSVSYKWSDTSNIYFNQKILRIELNKLIELDNHGIPTKAIYNNAKLPLTWAYQKPSDFQLKP